MTPHVFASATREELWSRGRVVEESLSHGTAVHRDGAIDANDSCDARLVSACDAELTRLQAARPEGDDVRVRLVADARRDGDVDQRSATMTVSIGALSIVTTPEDAADDVALLRGLAKVAVDEHAAMPVVPMVWRNGSAAVLLHEAVGHAAEHGHAPIEWPPWLAVEDDGVDLLHGLAPKSLRRASFRDVPLQRMTSLVVRQSSAPFSLPHPRIEVCLVAGGTYEPLTEEVTLHVAAADFIGEEAPVRLPPFAIVATRREIAASLAGAVGDPIRYPGVICSREGQELVVGSSAPVMVTRLR